MLTIRGTTIYHVTKLKSGYIVIRFPRYDDAELIASKLKSKQDALQIIEEDYNNVLFH
jgi:hypothetical protein